MKHKLLLYAALLTIAGACSKEKPADPAGKLYPVSFRISGLGVEYAPITKASPAPVTFVKYLILNSEGAQLSAKTITVSSEEDLNAEIYVPSGESTVYFAAGGAGTTGPDDITLTLEGSDVEIKGDYKEIFAKKVTVNPATATEYSAELERVTGAVELQILDAGQAPAGQEITSFGVTFAKKPVYYSLSRGTTAEGSHEANLYAVSSVSNGSGIIHVLPASEQNLYIELYTDVNSPTGKYNSYTVTAAVYKNRKTIIKGNIYGGTPNFSITIAEGWGENNEVTF